MSDKNNYCIYVSSEKDYPLKDSIKELYEIIKFKIKIIIFKKNIFLLDRELYGN